MKKILFSFTLLLVFILGGKVEASYSTNDKLPEVESIQILDKEVAKEGKAKVKIKFNENGNLKRLKYLQISFRSKFNNSPVVSQYYLTDKDFGKKELIIEVDKKEGFKDGEYVLEYLVIHGNERNKGMKRYSLGDLGTGFKSIVFGEGKAAYSNLESKYINKRTQVIEFNMKYVLHKNNNVEKVKVIDSKGDYKEVKVKFIGNHVTITPLCPYVKGEVYTLYLRDIEKSNGIKIKENYKMEFKF